MSVSLRKQTTKSQTELQEGQIADSLPIFELDIISADIFGSDIDNDEECPWWSYAEMDGESKPNLSPKRTEPKSQCVVDAGSTPKQQKLSKLNQKQSINRLSKSLISKPPHDDNTKIKQQQQIIKQGKVSNNQSNNKSQSQANMDWNSNFLFIRQSI